MGIKKYNFSINKRISVYAENLDEAREAFLDSPELWEFRDLDMTFLSVEDPTVESEGSIEFNFLAK